MATSKKSAADTSASPPPRTTPQAAATILWVHDAPVCVEIIDAPAPAPRDGVCRCAACHAAEFADWAERFLP